MGGCTSFGSIDGLCDASWALFINTGVPKRAGLLTGQSKLAPRVSTCS